MVQATVALYGTLVPGLAVPVYQNYPMTAIYRGRPFKLSEDKYGLDPLLHFEEADGSQWYIRPDDIFSLSPA